MTDLERARGHLLFERRNLAMARKYRSTFGGLDHHENAFLAALSWVWEEQEKADRLIPWPCDFCGATLP